MQAFSQKYFYILTPVMALMMAFIPSSLMMGRWLSFRRHLGNFPALPLAIGSIGIRIGPMSFPKNKACMLSCCFRILMLAFLVRISGRQISLEVKLLRLLQPLWTRLFIPLRRLKKYILPKRIFKNLYQKFKANGSIILALTDKSIMMFNKIYHIKW